MGEQHRAHGAGVLPEVLIVRPSVFVQNGLGEERLTADVAAIASDVRMAIEVILEAVLKWKGSV